MCIYCSKIGLELHTIGDNNAINLFLCHNTIINPAKYRYCNNCINLHYRLLKGVYDKI